MKKTILALLAAFLIVFPVVFWALDAIPPTPGLILYNLSQLFALVGFNLLTMQFLLTSRIPLLEKGLGQDRLFRIHRRFGIFGFAAVAVHGILYTTWELVNMGTISVSVLKTLGVVGLVLVALIAVVAMYHDRLGMKYETWKNIHRLTFLILPMVFIHSILLGSTLNRTPALRIQWFVLIGLYALVVIYRASILVWIRSRPFTVAAVDQETHDTWTLACDGPRPEHYPG